MIVNCQVSRKKKLHKTRKPFYGNFYSQWTYDTIGGNIPPRMSEDELRRHIYFGNVRDPAAAHFNDKLKELNSVRGDHDRPDEFADIDGSVVCGEVDDQDPEQDLRED